VLAFMGPLTGDGANIGQHMLNGVRLAVDRAADEADPSVRLTVKAFDTQLDPGQARTLADRILEDPRVVGIVGPATSGETKAVAPVFEEAGLPVVTPSASNPELARQGWRIFRRMVVNDDVQSAEVARYIAGPLGMTQLAIVHDNSEYGKGLADLTKAAVEARGVRVDPFGTIDPKAADYSAVVNTVKSRRAPAVFFVGIYDQAGRLVRQLHDAGVSVPFISGDGSKDPGIATIAGDAAEGVTVICGCADLTADEDPEAKSFTDAYTARFGGPPGTYAAESYDAAALFVNAVRRGAQTAAQVLAMTGPGMETFDGLTKRLSFTDRGEIAASTVYVYTFTGGRFRLAGTTEDLAA
jgi:branched-chain amino acid transport system substrate-binding protein